MAVIYVLIVEVFIYRDIPISQLPEIMREAMVLVGAIIVILGASLASTNYLVDAEVPTRLFDLIQEHIDSKITFLLLLNIFLLVTWDKSLLNFSITRSGSGYILRELLRCVDNSLKFTEFALSENPSWHRNKVGA